MADGHDFDLDKALGRLADAEARHAPRPGPELTARVLADAAAIAERRVAPPESARARGWRLRLPSVDIRYGAALAMGLCLTVGFGLGYEGALPGSDFEMAAASAEGEMAALLLAGLPF